MRPPNRNLIWLVRGLVVASVMSILVAAIGLWVWNRTHGSSLRFDKVKTLREKLDELGPHWGIDSAGPSGPLMTANVSGPYLFVQRRAGGEASLSYRRGGKTLSASKHHDDTFSYLIVIIEVPGTADEDYVILRRSREHEAK